MTERLERLKQARTLVLAEKKLGQGRYVRVEESGNLCMCVIGLLFANMPGQDGHTLAKTTGFNRSLTILDHKMGQFRNKVSGHWHLSTDELWSLQKVNDEFGMGQPRINVAAYLTTLITEEERKECQSLSQSQSPCTGLPTPETGESV